MPLRHCPNFGHSIFLPILFFPLINPLYFQNDYNLSKQKVQSEPAGVRE
ncbi:hypothetical protein CLOSTHATH_04991 [Hungatella hathewayi DSM 13479]|uniref:Uncharacterized protein n=1 Tax=Hungatella hathewayi DSM 13479 TaxID=566550 RepID=D3AMZ0_9FIRM|nr:hypothetical protein CLOSTHATH_04991 [Hungatella hathewayi DSM 13479]